MVLDPSDECGILSRCRYPEDRERSIMKMGIYDNNEVV